MIGTEGKVCGLEDTATEITQSEQQREHRIKNIKKSLRDLWDYNKTANVHITGAPGEERESRA